MKYLLALLLLLGSFSSYALETAVGEVARIYPSGNTVSFKLKKDQCNPNHKYYYFTLDSEVKKAWYALILAAANSAKPIRVSVAECPTDANVEIRYLLQDF